MASVTRFYRIRGACLAMARAASSHMYGKAARTGPWQAAPSADCRSLPHRARQHTTDRVLLPLRQVHRSVRRHLRAGQRFLARLMRTHRCARDGVREGVRGVRSVERVRLTGAVTCASARGKSFSPPRVRMRA